MLSKNLSEHLQQSLSKKFNQHIIISNAFAVHGGDINQAYKLQTSDGNYFLKLNHASFPDMFEKEYNGLSSLRNANAIHVPEPLLHGTFEEQIFLIMQFIEKGKPGKNFWQQFAHGLAKLHQQTQSQFGLQENNYIGNLSQNNSYTTTWKEFYTTNRIMPLIQLAHQQNKCSATDINLAEQVCKKLGEIFPDEAPALLHGDLWSGNFMCNANGEAVIYDPAVYYGNREMDIAMTLLFGGFDKSFYDHYNEAHPLQQVWKQRVSLCQLYPLLVHLILFGGHYYNSVMQILKSYE